LSFYYKPYEKKKEILMDISPTIYIPIKFIASLKERKIYIMEEKGME